MVVDTSALFAILVGEPRGAALLEAIERADTVLLSAASWVEMSIVIHARYGAAGVQLLDDFVETAQVKIVPVDEPQAREARRAYQTFGKGFHPASLNFGDCFAYALAAVEGEPLLFQGTDFARTDISSVM